MRCGIPNIQGLYICRVRWALLAVCLIVPAPLLAQHYPFHNLDREDGLAQNQATCLAQDRVGNLWIGTPGGLSRYDGKNFTNYTVKDGLRSNAVYAVAADAQGHIWMAGPAGLEEFNGKAVAYFDIPAHGALPAGSNQQVLVAGDTVWWRAGGTVYFIVKGELNRFNLPGTAGFVSCILAEKDGLWIAKDSTVYHYGKAGSDSMRFAVAAGQKQPTVNRIFRNKNGVVWVATTGGLYSTDNHHLVAQPLVADSLAKGAVIMSITEDRAGALWLGTDNGVIKVAGKSVQFYDKHNGLGNGTFPDMLTDSSGNVWMASEGQGIFRFSGTQFSALDETMGLPAGPVTAIAGNNRDSLFLGTNAGVYIFKDGPAARLAFPSNPAPAVTALCYTSRHHLWIGTRDRGLWSYERAIFRQYAYPERKFPSNTIASLYEDTAHRLWVGFSNGALVLDQSKYVAVLAGNGPVVAFLPIGRDSMLMATGKGVMLYHAGIVAAFKTNTIADSASIACLLLKGRELWMGSSGKGIIRYNLETNKAAVINKNNGLRSDDIYSMVAGADGNLLAGTGYGIDKISMDGSGPVRVTFYGSAQGVTGMESTRNAVLAMRDGTTWIGVANGALHYQPHTEVASTKPTNIVLQAVNVAGEQRIPAEWHDSVDSWYGIPFGLRLPYKENSVSFTFQAISPGGTQQLLYRYRMDGLETPWSDWSATNTASYPSLPPGDYVFHVECRGDDAQASAELAYPFEVITPVQKTWWFRLGMLLGCGLAGIGLHFLYSRSVQRRARRQMALRTEEQNRARLRMVEGFRDGISNKLAGINLLADMLKNKVSATKDTERILGQIAASTGRLYNDANDLVWALQPANDNLYGLLHHIYEYGVELFRDTDTDFAFNGISENWRQHHLPVDMGQNLVAICKEAMDNSMQHAKAHNVWIEATVKNRDVVHLALRDNGVGFDADMPRKGNGINSMNARAARMNGRLYIDARVGKGVIVSLWFRVPRRANY